MKNKKKRSIKIKILYSTLILVAVILFGIFIAFNVLVNSYIDKNANNKLKEAYKAVKSYGYEELNEFKPGKPYGNGFDKSQELEDENTYSSDNKEIFNKNMKHLIKYVGEKSSAQAMIINKDDGLLYPTSEEYYVYNISYLEDIISVISKNNKDLEEGDAKKISIDEKNYYVFITQLDKTYNDKPYYIVLFVDINEQLNLIKSINTLLFVIMCVAGTLTIFTTLFLSETISKPIKKISKFAKQIGDGDFTKSDMEFKEKELDELLKVMNKSAEYLDKYDKDQKIFFQNISHELRTPLMSMMGYAEAIQYNIMDKNKACNIILEEGNKLKDMVEELLYISRINNITQESNISNYDLRDILASCVESKNATAIKKNIKLICDFDDKKVMYLCDEKSLSRAFLNIIENGLRYATSQINVQCKLIDSQIIIIIENDGININEKDMPHIFERFYKGEQGKTGIGLSIVKSIIENHNGSIYCENTQIGVRFIIKFHQN